MLVSLGIALFWDRFPIISSTVHLILDPIAGNLLNWNVNIGMIIFTALISLFITLIQKYTTDQDTLREIKKEQKLINQQMKEFRNNQEKVAELSRKSLELIPKTMEITLRPLMYTSFPIIILFRWFHDYFDASSIKVLGMNWLLGYIILSIIFSMIWRKVFNVA